MRSGNNQHTARPARPTPEPGSPNVGAPKPGPETDYQRAPSQPGLTEPVAANAKSAAAHQPEHDVLAGTDAGNPEPSRKRQRTLSRTNK